LKLCGTKLYSVGIERYGQSVGCRATGFGAGRTKPALANTKDTKIHQHQNNKNSTHALIPHRELTLMATLH
jgi:hypothetical protein